MSLQKLGRYDIVRVLGKGAMGIVYEARDPILERRVAIKTVSLENLSGGAAAEYEARFRVEARSAARLQHPNIVSVYDSGWEGGLAFLVMEYVQGEDLKQHLDLGERYSLEQSIGMMGDLLAALEYAHKQGIVHRDVKPANLLMESSGRLKLTDFGVARIQDSGDVTRTQGTVVGTLKYMSPEQAQGQKIDPRADLYSAGVVLYQLLTDKRPFDVENEFSLAQQIVHQPATPPSALNSRLPKAIDEVVMRALAKKPDQRFATAVEFASALRSAVGHAEDTTVFPPADPARTAARLAAGTGSLTTSSGASSTGNSTITQELELVYWKDVKDSADAEDLHVFLAKFPAGVYADLARRQLRKLAGGTGTGQPPLGVTEATLHPPVATPQEPEFAAPEVLSTSEKPTSQAAASVSETQPGVAPIGEAVANDESEQPSQEEDTAQILAARSASDPDLKIADRGPEPAAQESADQAVAPTTSPHSAVPGAPSRRWKLLIAGGAGVAICVVAALLVVDGGGNGMPAAKTAGQATVAAPVASTPAPVELGATSYSAPVEAAAQRASTTEQGASAATKTSKRPIAPKAAMAASTPESPQLPQATDQARARAAAESSRARPASASVSAPAPAPAPLIAAEASPVDGCQDKSFLSREYCLNQECGKPGARSHPLCVRHREVQRLREEGRVRN